MMIKLKGGMLVNIDFIAYVTVNPAVKNPDIGDIAMNRDQPHVTLWEDASTKIACIPFGTLAEAEAYRDELHERMGGLTP